MAVVVVEATAASGAIRVIQLDPAKDQGLRVRTYHLLGGVRPRRVWTATVSPGYDDRALVSADGRTPRVSERDGGAYYDAQWRAALEAGADWMVVTSWNEWWENTQVEPSVRYGDLYAGARASGRPGSGC